jgi:tight adherence protein B
MTKDTQALLVLVAASVVALIGVAMLAGTLSRRAELVGRGGEGLDDGRSAGITYELDLQLRRTGVGGRLNRWLSACGSPLKAIDFVLIVAAVMAVLFLFLLLFVGWQPSAIAAIAIGWIGAKTWGERRRARRTEAFIQQLPELARTLSNGASAGLSMSGAVTLAARESSEPASTELGTVVEELRLGRSMDEALAELRQRLPSREVSVLVTTLIIQQRSGGDTVKALGELAETLEARKDLRREVKTLLAGTVYTSYLIAGMGVGTLVLMNAITPGVLREMTSSLVGIIAFSVAGILWAVAFVLIRNMTKIEL